MPGDPEVPTARDRLGFPGIEMRHGYIEVGSARLFCRSLGSGLPLVVLHGGPDLDHNYLVPEMDRLGEGLWLTYYDQRGRGRSASGVAPGDVSIESEIEDLERVRDHLGVGAMDLLGHSWGGVLAAEYVIRHPDRVSHLILMNSAPLSQRRMKAFRSHLRGLRSSQDLEEMSRLREEPTFRAGDPSMDAEYCRVHFKPAVRNPKVLEEIVGRLRVHFTPEGILLARAIEDRLYDETWESPGYNLLPDLAVRQVPTLVLHGEYDFIPVEVAAEVADAVPGSRLSVLDGCGHFAYAENPDRVARVVLDFVGV